MRMHKSTIDYLFDYQNVTHNVIFTYSI